jgi:hypothetical protein
MDKSRNDLINCGYPLWPTLLVCLRSHPCMQTTIFNNTISDELSQDICNQHRFHLLNARKKNSYCTEENGKRKITKTIRTRNKKKKKNWNNSESTLSIKMYPNHSQKKILKRWLGLTRYVYNTVVRWNKNRIKSQTLNENLNYMYI